MSSKANQVSSSKKVDGNPFWSVNHWNMLQIGWSLERSLWVSRKKTNLKSLFIAGSTKCILYVQISFSGGQKPWNLEIYGSGFTTRRWHQGILIENKGKVYTFSFFPSTPARHSQFLSFDSGAKRVQIQMTDCSNDLSIKAWYASKVYPGSKPKNSRMWKEGESRVQVQK